MSTVLLALLVGALVLFLVGMGLRFWLADQLDYLATLAAHNNDPDVLVSVASSANAARVFWFASPTQIVYAARIARLATRRARLLV